MFFKLKIFFIKDVHLSKINDGILTNKEQEYPNCSFYNKPNRDRWRKNTIDSIMKANKREANKVFEMLIFWQLYYTNDIICKVHKSERERERGASERD